MDSTVSGISDSEGFSNFKYAPLNLSSQPSIRLAILQPAPREASVRVKLVHSAFADRPQYEALSYTWGSPNEIKAIELNGTRVFIRLNLWNALQNLRSPTEERVLWIDAICIDQGSNHEKNHQVKLMAYIYSRAQEVIVWLGLSVEPHEYQGNEAIESSWPIDMALCYRPYWKRIWIVQEIGAATELRVYWGVKSATWSDFFAQIQESKSSLTDPARKLAKLREDRHGDSYLLVNLMEVCQNSVCAEPRDKIYGFVGIAHDCQDGSLSVDYSKPLFEVYEDVVNFQYTSTAYIEAPKRTVHFSQLVQKLFGGHAVIQRDFLEKGGHQLHPMMERRNHDFPSKTLNVIGALAGRIMVMGPSYSEIVANPEATKSWTIMVSQAAYRRQLYVNLVEIRRMNEGFLRVLLELKDADVAKIRPIFQAPEWAFTTRVGGPIRRISPGQDNLEIVSEIGKQTSPEHTMIRRSDDSTRNDPRLFITDDYLLGLAQPNAVVGDEVIQFDGSDTVAVLRWKNSYFSLVGRAAIANGQYKIGSKFYVPDERSRRANEPKFDRLVCVDMYSLSLLTQ